MAKLNLIVNTGSASRKYALYDGDRQVVFVHLEYDEKKPVCTFLSGDYREKISITETDFKNSLDFTISNLIEKKYLTNKGEILAIGIRVVASGNFFLQHKIIDREYEKNLKLAGKRAPLHINPVLEEIARIKRSLKNTKLIGISDSAFHFTMPEYARYYAIDKNISDKLELYHFGYHGISIKSIISKLEERGSLPNRIIVCHIGGGVSITAVKDGKSIDTSMGFTPLEGPVMATRVGDIDSGALLYLLEKSGIRRNKMLNFLNTKSGLLGISGTSSDVRDLLKIENIDNNARLALSMYAYRIAKYIGSYTVALGGLDGLIFTGTVGERSFIMRGRICKILELFGLRINTEKNNMIEGIDGDITGVASTAKVLVIKTDEMQQMAKEVRAFI